MSFSWIDSRKSPLSPTLSLLAQYLNDPQVSKILPITQKMDSGDNWGFKGEKKKICKESKQAAADFVAAARRRLVEME